MADEDFVKPFTGNWTLENVTINNEQLLLGQPGYAISEIWKTGEGPFHIFKNKYGEGLYEDIPDFDYRTASDRSGIENAEWIPLVTNNIVSSGYIQLRILLYESVSSSSRSSSSSSNSSSSSSRSSSSSSCRSSSSSCRSSSSSSSSSYYMTYIFGEGRPAGDTSKRWQNLATTSNGSKILTGIDGGRVYYSTDYGISWIELQPDYPSGPYNKGWRAFGVSDDGSVLVLYYAYDRYSPYVYTSTNGGGSWTITNVYCYGSIAMTPTASRIMVAGNAINISTDYGASWTERRPTTYDKWWYGCDCNSTGQHIIACYGGGQYDSNPDHYNYDGRVYTSNDYGVTWTERQPAGNNGFKWFKAKCNSSGSFMMVCSNSSDSGSGRIYISNDYGVTWNETRPAGDVDRPWYGITCNETGTMLMAAMGTFIYDHCLYISLNGGVSWDPFPKFKIDDYLVSLVSSNDMHKIYTGQGYGYIKLGTSTLV